jgi:hypothetical protein
MNIVKKILFWEFLLVMSCFLHANDETSSLSEDQIQPLEQDQNRWTLSGANLLILPLALINDEIRTGVTLRRTYKNWSLGVSQSFFYEEKSMFDDRLEDKDDSFQSYSFIALSAFLVQFHLPFSANSHFSLSATSEIGLAYAQHQTKENSLETKFVPGGKNTLGLLSHWGTKRQYEVALYFGEFSLLQPSDSVYRKPFWFDFSIGYCF